jgi:ATP-binding cassette subfamily B protein
MLLGQLQQPFASFSAVLPVFYARAASAERLAEADEMPEDEVESMPQIDYDTMRAFQAQDVTFSYGRTEILTDANAMVERGKIVCITGESGSGKSTLFKLLLSVYRPTNGGLYAVNGNGDKIAVTSEARGLFAYVPQGNFLFSGTIYENFEFFVGKEKASDEKAVQDALDAACAQFVYELPEKLNTSLKERGAGLSEGQLQRLAIARAILSDRPVLLLDEATSALDGETERQVLENIRRMKGKTCLFVTHRPAALAIADEILEVKEGKILSVRKAMANES